MKVVRYAVQVHPEGWAVWELCSDWYARCACRYELWCQCLHSSGGPLLAVVKVVATLGQALDVCEVLEAAQGGVKELSGEWCASDDSLRGVPARCLDVGCDLGEWCC